MTTCSFYREDVKKVQSREIRPDRQPADASVVRIPWCAHKHSPAQHKIAISVVGGANLLTCGGSLEKCQIPRNLLADV
jgi:hypothetical protein